MTAPQRNITLAIAAASLVAIGFFVGRSMRPDTPNGAGPAAPVDQKSVPETSAPKTTITPKNFFELRREYDQTQKSPTGVQWDFIEKAEAYAEKTKDSTDDNDIRTLDLLTDCYLKFGELEDARAAFKKYLDRVDRTKGIDEGAKRCRNKADQLFYRDANYFNALAFYEIMSSRYPDTDNAAYGQFMAGKYFLRTKEYDQAIQEFNAFTERYPSSKYARKAKQELYTLYFNQGDKQKAIDLMLRYANDYKEEDDICYANFKVGMAYYAMGSEKYDTANRHFKLIADKYPNPAAEGGTSPNKPSLWST